MATTPKSLFKAASATRHSCYVGRVGGLAVAVGIGLAIANSPAAAVADDGSSGPDSSSSSSTSSSAASDSNDSATDRDSPTSRKARRQAEADDDRKHSDGEAAQALETTTPTPTRRRSVRVASLPSGESAVEHEPSGATDDPAAPVQSAAVWTLAGSARREQGTDATTAASPLGTDQQLDAERIAAETVQTGPVKLMKLVLRVGWQATAKREYDRIGGPDPENLDQLTRAIDEYAMGAAFQQQLLNSMQPTVVTQVAPPHTWYGQTVGGSRILYDNPDTIYRFMGVNKTSTYVINGRFTGEMPADTSFSLLTGLSGVTADYLSAREIEVAPDGSFTITLSAEPAAPGQRNHLQLTADSTLVAVRNTLSDWNNQPPMSLSIERVSGPPNSLFSQLGGFAIPLLGPTVVNSPLLTALVSLIPPLADPPPMLRGTFTAVVMALGLSQEAKYIKVATTDPVTGERVEPNVLRNPMRNAEFLATQLQSAGYFDLGDDEALVVTITPNNARYFTVPVTNLWTITDDYRNAQTSLNNAQAVANPDGTYTFVISPTDPGVRNWVSTGGLNQGTISIRFQDLDPGSTLAPTVTSQVVSLPELGTVLPPSTSYVNRWQRHHQLAVRKAGFDERFAPYPQR